MDAGARIIRLRYPGTCSCGQVVFKGQRAGYSTETRKIICLQCIGKPIGASGEQSLIANSGEAGASLNRTYERRVARREQRVRKRFPRIGGFLLTVTPEPTSTTAFKKGAEGEARAARRIMDRSGPEVKFLLNRKLGRGRRDGDIDMIAISPAGVLIIDVKHYKNAKVEVRRSGGVLRPRVEKLFVGGRDKSRWMAGLKKQRDAVHAALDHSLESNAVPVRVALCFVDGDLPMFTRLEFGGALIYGSKDLGRKLKSKKGPLDSQAISRTFERLSTALPPA